MYHDTTFRESIDFNKAVAAQRQRRIQCSHELELPMDGTLHVRARFT